MDFWRYVPRESTLLIVFTNLNFCLGGFQDGDTSLESYQGETVVARSLALGEPVVYVSANYRLNGKASSCIMIYHLYYEYLAFGFLGGKEAQAAKIGNAGLRDRTSFIHGYICCTMLTH